MRADLAHQIQLALHFMTRALLGLRFTQPVGEQRIGVFAAVCETARDACLVTEHCGRQRALAIDGENHGSIETAAPEPLLNRVFV
jgi:hypothetical protein